MDEVDESTSTERLVGVGLRFLHHHGAWPQVGGLSEPLEALRGLWEVFLNLCRRMRYIQVEVNRYVSTTLFEAP